jgi:tetratricopeptide (TPR) repeat protein
MNQSAERKGVGRGAWFRLRLIFLPQVPGPALWALVLVIALAFCSLFETAHALTFDYDPLRPTELRTCDDHRYRGREEAAQECYTELFVSSRNDALRAQAVWAMGDLAAANVLFRQYLRVSPNAVIPRNAWGRLYLETHQDDEALKLFREALKIDAANVQAKLGMAQIFVNRFEGQARALVAEVLKKNDDLIEAHLLLARMDLEEGKLEEAERSVDRAFTLTEKQKQPPLEVYALRATLDLMRGGDGAKWIGRALAYNAHYGSVYEAMAHSEVIRRRYLQAAALLRKAVEVEPGLSSAHAELGANLLRLGATEEGQKHLATAYEGDPYDITTVNSLRLLDRFNEFEASTSNDEFPVQLRLHNKEAAALHPYVLQLAQQSIATYAKRYHFKPTQTITVELYPNHDDFAVRVAGLPGIGLLGVTFGYLVAMDSPSGRPVGDFHWGSTLWHEMAHVFTLEATDHRVPRWLSEGISVFEEWRTGPTPGVVVTPDVLRAFNDGKFLKIEDLDSGFIRPNYPNQVQVSYTQAGLTCLFIEQRFGFDRLVAFLYEFKKEISVAAAVKSALSISAAEFDRQFDTFMKQRYAKILPKAEEWQRNYEAAEKAAQKEDWSAVVEPARATIELYSEHVGEGSPYLVLAKAYDNLKQPERALQTLLDYRRAGGWDPNALRELAQQLQNAKRNDEALDVMLAINYSDPLNADSHQRYADASLAANRPQDALREYKALLALNTHDTATAYLGAARSLRMLGDRAGSRRNVLQALEAAPYFRDAQNFLLEMVEERE